VYDNYFTSVFVEHSVDGVTKDYAENCVVSLYNLTFDTKDVYAGKECIEGMWSDILDLIRDGGDSNIIDHVNLDIGEDDKVFFATWKDPTPSMSFFSIFSSLDDEFKIVRHSIIMKMSDIEIPEEDPSYPTI